MRLQSEGSALGGGSARPCGHRMALLVVGALGAGIVGCEIEVPEGIGLSTQYDAGAAAPSGCVDEDGDGYGEGCALGPDCDDSSRITHPEGYELCNEIDDDCDGRIDEDYRLGEECTFGYAGCRVPGFRACSHFDTGTCMPHSRHESCDGVDNDCDGITDEGNPGGAQPCVADLPGRCSEGSLFCDTALDEVVCRSLLQPTFERCNNIDDDCDGSVDEGEDGGPLVESCFSGDPEAEGVGQCAAGLRTCDYALYQGVGPCIGAVAAQPEECDGLDNDCDGVVDEVGGEGCACNAALTPSEVCYSGAPATLDVGPCAAGTRVCIAGASGTCEVCDDGVWTQCDGEVTPTEESCNDIDDDCDGAVDEDLGLGGACWVGVGGCRVEGLRVCAPDGTVQCGAEAGLPAQEACNGVDDDCDGIVDNVTGLGDACTAGSGACSAVGVMVCGAGSIACSATAGAPAAEICNTVDDDCDGATDEGLGLGDACTVGAGDCARSGVRVCGLEGDVICSVSAGDPGPETCDARDNDCDGAVDEGLGLGNFCDGVGECGEGVRECGLNGAVRCSTDPGGSGSGAVAELCDGLDNDCDQQIDESFPLGDSCYGACDTGSIECGDAGVPQCSTSPGGSEYDPQPEVCNFQDDDCDGAYDEGLGLWDDCGVGACDGGSVECAADGTAVCSTEPGGSFDQTSPEVCDFSDNDCDGTTDEGVTNACGGCGAVPNETCNGADDDCDGQTDEGVLNACGGCGAVPNETCNGVDDDCDGPTDEGFGLGDACDGVGACGAGTVECDGAGATRCSTDAGGSASEAVAEICDGLDNDCDGAVDEGVSNACGGCGAVPGETCNGVDDDCDGQTDEGFDVGLGCDGVGECGTGALECDGAGGVRCSSDPGGTTYILVPETEANGKCSNTLDDDCDGLIDLADPDCP